jgi:hypothetical protein
MVRGPLGLRIAFKSHGANSGARAGRDAFG